MAKETSIIDIFNRMNYNDCEAENTDDKKIRQLYPDLNYEDKPQSLTTVIEWVKDTVQTQDVQNWKRTPHEKALALLDIGRKLSQETNKLLTLQDFREKDYSLLIGFFNYYSKMCYVVDELWTSNDYVLISLTTDVPFFILGSVISAAFGAGLPVIVVYSIKNPWFLFFLKRLFSRTVLPKNFFNFVPNDHDTEKHLGGLDFWKIVCLGHHSVVWNLQKRIHLKPLSFVIPNNATTIIFEFCDLSAAVDKIFNETWNKKFATMWGVSIAVVQESVYKKFLDRLKLRIDQLTDEKERVLIKNCIISEEDQNREVEANIPVLKVLSFRTANEGVNFLNNYRYYLGTSIWSENLSQALEVASKLICKNVWINCHGVIEPSVPFQPSGWSGAGVFGGYEGILDYMDFPSSGRDGLFVKSDSIHSIKTELEETLLLAQKAFKEWLLVENKEMHLTKILESLKELNASDMPYLSDAIIEVLSVNEIKPVIKSCNRNFYIIHERSPIGVIAIVLEDFGWKIIFLITTAIALGNAVIVTVRESKLTPLVKTFVEVFKSHLPRGLVNLIGAKPEDAAEILLEPNTIIQAVWLFPEIRPFLKPVGGQKCCKRVWFIPDLFEDFNLHAFIYQRECLNSKIIWMSKVDHFP